MAIYSWKASLSVGIDEIDSQHKQLIQYINDLSEIIDKKASQEEVRKIFDALFEYTRNHFSLEEKLMEKHGYPLYEAHKKAHDNFCEKVIAFFEDYSKGKPVGEKLVTYLGTWLITHIAKDDKDYEPFMKSAMEKESKSKWYQSLIKKIWKK